MHVYRRDFACLEASSWRDQGQHRGSRTRLALGKGEDDDADGIPETGAEVTEGRA